MREIPLSVNGRKHAGRFVALVDDEDYQLMSSTWWNPLIKPTTHGDYVRAIHSERVSLGWITRFMHRDIFEHAHGPIPEGMTVDHIVQGEFGGLDNRRCNIRLATYSQQRGNTQKRRCVASRFKGVAKVTGADRWQATVHVHGRNLYLGSFLTDEAAARAYDIAALEVFGDYSRLNFPEKVTC